MSEFSSIRDLIAQLDKEDERWEKETQKHFENQRDKYREMFEKVKDVKDKSIKCMENIMKGLDHLNANKHTIEKALEQTDGLDGLPISPEQQDNAVDVIGKIAKLINNIDLITSPIEVSPEQIQKEVVSYTASIAEDLKNYKTDLHQISALSNKTQKLSKLTKNSDDSQNSKHANGMASDQMDNLDPGKKSERKLPTITECE